MGAIERISDFEQKAGAHIRHEGPVRFQQIELWPNEKSFPDVHYRYAIEIRKGLWIEFFDPLEYEAISEQVQYEKGRFK
jgi:hypothetical protein